MPFAHTPRGPVHWVESNSDADAPPVVLLHGLGGDASFWAVEQQALSARFRVLAIDLRGSGLTPGSAAPFSMNDLAADVITVLDAASITAAHVIGFSMGGSVAQALAIAVPERVRSLVLAATFATVNQQVRRFLLAVSSVYQSGATAKQMFELVLPWLFSQRFFSDRRAAAYLAYQDNSVDEQSREDWLQLLNAQLAFDGRTHLADIKVPTLVICGDEDRLAPRSDSEQLVNGISTASLQMLAGGHLLNVESPAEFFSQLEQFILLHGQ